MIWLFLAPIAAGALLLAFGLGERRGYEAARLLWQGKAESATAQAERYLLAAQEWAANYKKLQAGLTGPVLVKGDPEAPPS